MVNLMLQINYYKFIYFYKLFREEIQRIKDERGRKRKE